MQVGLENENLRMVVVVVAVMEKFDRWWGWWWWWERGVKKEVVVKMVVEKYCIYLICFRWQNLQLVVQVLSLQGHWPFFVSVKSS